MGKIEERLFDLEEYLRRNDDNADSSAYLTIVGIANEVSKLESENAKLRELARSYVGAIEDCGCDHCPYYEDEGCPTETEPMREGCRLRSELRLMGVEVDQCPS